MMPETVPSSKARMVADGQEERPLRRDACEQQRPGAGDGAISLPTAQMEMMGVDGDTHPVLPTPVSLHPFVVCQRHRRRREISRVGMRSDLGGEIGIHIIADAEGIRDVRYFVGVGLMVAGRRDLGPDHHLPWAGTDKARLPRQVANDHFGQRLGLKVGLGSLIPRRDSGDEVGLEANKPRRERFGVGHGRRIPSPATEVNALVANREDIILDGMVTSLPGDYTITS